MNYSKHIYFMKPEGLAGPIKIGCSQFIGTRLTDLARWSPVRLVILASSPGSHLLERCLHRIYKDYRSHGEWFWPTPDMLSRIQRVADGEDVADAFEAKPVFSSRYSGGISRYRSKLEKPASRSRPKHEMEAA